MRECKIVSEEIRKLEWYEKASYKEANTYIGNSSSVMAREYVATGFWFRHIRDNKMYLEDGYKNIYEFALEKHGYQKSTVNHCMRVNEQFSKGGRSPMLDARYSGFSRSQLQEMLYLQEDKRDDVTPDMTVKEIRSMKNDRLDVEPKMDSPIPGQMSIEDYPECMPEDEAEVESVQEPVSVLGYPRRVYPEGSLIATPGCGKYDCFCCHYEGCEIRGKECYCVESTMANPSPCTVLNVVDSIRQDIGDKCQFVNKDLAFHRAGDGQPVPCCKECNNPCGYECRRSVIARHEAAKKNICDDARNETFEEKHETSIDDLNLSVRTNNILKRAGVNTIEELQSMTDVDLTMVRNMSRRCVDEVHSKFYEYAVKAAESVIEPDENVIDPELPILKNNDQRKAFLDNYQTWPVWFEVPEASEVYHRFDLPDGSSIVICKYNVYYEWKEKYTDESPHGIATREYLLKPGYHYLHDCLSNRTALAEHLKEVQKNHG